MEDELSHIGIIRRSGRYPWGSGDNKHQRALGFMDYIRKLMGMGLSDAEIAKGLNLNSDEEKLTSSDIRAGRAIAIMEIRKADESMARRLKDKGYSNVAIGQRMGKNESTVRALLDPSASQRNDVLQKTTDLLKSRVAEDKYIDVGTGQELYLNVSKDKLSTSLAMLKEEGYKIMYVKTPQLGTTHETSIKVLVPPDTTYSELYKERANIRGIQAFTDDYGETYRKIVPPKSIDSKRVAIRYAEEGGADADGVIYIRRGVDDVSLGKASYAQVRIAVDDTHYIKGMAVYKDGLPDGVDLLFNTNKSDTGNKLDALKSQKDDPENPFGSVTRQRYYKDKNGKEQLSVINTVGDNEEGRWREWSNNLSTQMLSKQTPALAKQQLDLAYQQKREEYDEIMALTNPVVKKYMLEKFADSADSAAVHLKAASLPRQGTHVILPMNSLKDNEIYAPNYKNGENVVLIRHPHGGRFEIPELRVNNRNQEGKSLIGAAADAVGINANVASRLSGADFDGDTVIVIPNPHGAVKTGTPLAELKNFDPKNAYPKYDGMKVMNNTQREMGDISNLITDMTIRGASQAELARAVKHSMVVIDAEKHELNYKQSARDNGIAQLKEKYQGKTTGGASTLISRATSDVSVPARVARKASEGGPIDPKTGKKVYTETGETYTDKKGKTVKSTTTVQKLANTDDAYTLSSGTPMEAIYADHSNRLKALSNTARKSYLATTPKKYSPSAAKTYASQVASLRAKLNVAKKNAPLERQAQLLANATVQAKRQANPNMDADTLKKVRSSALATSRIRTGADKKRVDITPIEWEAIQSGAVSTHVLSQILTNGDLEQIKTYATPRATTSISDVKMARARALLAAGHTQAEIAESLGVPTSTLNDALSRE